jgi:hypothetical protein
MPIKIAFEKWFIAVFRGVSKWGLSFEGAKRAYKSGDDELLETDYIRY